MVVAVFSPNKDREGANMTMRKILATLAATTFMGIGVASAADLAAKPYTKAPPPVPPSYSWTGCYVGANGGYGWGSNTATLAPSPDPASQAFWLPAFAAGAAPSTFRYSTSGGLAGGQVGCNYQTGKFVFGGEADIDWANLKGSQAITTSGIGGFVPGFFSSGQTLNWLGTVRGRAGFAVTDQLLIYATGGLAYGNVNYNLSFAFPNTNDFHTISASSTSVGWTVGAGTEWAFAPSWSVKFEYLYADLGNKSFVSVL